MQAHLIPFHSDSIVAYERDGQLYVAIKPICERLGISFEPQLAKLRTDKDRWGMTIIVIPSASGAQQTACLPKAKLFGWLNSIHPGKVAEKARPALRRYQAECDAVLDAWWSRKLGLPGGFDLNFDLQGNQVLISIADTLRLLVERQDNLERRVAELARDNHALADYAGGNVPALRITPTDVRLAPYKVARPKGDMPRLRLTPGLKRSIIRLIEAGFSSENIAKAINASPRYVRTVRKVLEAEGRIVPNPALYPIRKRIWDEVAAVPRPRRSLDPAQQRHQMEMQFEGGAKRHG